MDLAQLIRTAVAIAAPNRTITFDQLNDLVRSDLEPRKSKHCFRRWAKTIYGSSTN